MREILFRGKRLDNGEWVYGDLAIRIDGETTIYDRPSGNGLVCSVGRCVIPESVGQYTGLCENGKNGKKIFEGDIVKAQDNVFGSPFDTGIIGKIVYEETAFFIETQNVMESQYLYNECAVYEVLGNIHDNPELLKGADDEKRQINKPTNITT